MDDERIIAKRNILPRPHNPMCQMFSIARNGCEAILVLTAMISLFVSSASAQPPDWTPQRLQPTRSPGQQPIDEGEVLQSKRIVWPAPVRQAQYIETHDQSIAESGGEPYYEATMNGYGNGDQFENALATPTHAHQVIRAPGPKPLPNSHGSMSSNGEGERPPNHPLHPNYRLHHQVQPVAATIPEARQTEIWKTPYSYGYFGASGTRQWSLHNGYRDKYTEWRLR